MFKINEKSNKLKELNHQKKQWLLIDFVIEAIDWHFRPKIDKVFSKCTATLLGRFVPLPYQWLKMAKTAGVPLIGNHKKSHEPTEVRKKARVVLSWKKLGIPCEM